MVLFGAKALDQYPRNKGLWGWGDVVASLIVIAQVLTYTRSSNRHCCQVSDLYANSWCYHAFFGAYLDGERSRKWLCFYPTQVPSLPYPVSLSVSQTWKFAQIVCHFQSFYIDFCKLLHAFVKIDKWMSLSYYKDLSKLVQGFL